MLVLSFSEYDLVAWTEGDWECLPLLPKMATGLSGSGGKKHCMPNYISFGIGLASVRRHYYL